MEADRHKKLLVVDDDPAQLKLLHRILSKGEYEVLTAKDGKEALRIVLTDEPRIVVTDLVMPEMSGLALGEEIARRLPAVPVLYMSGYTDDIIVHQGILQAGTHLLPKPFTITSLTEKVRDVLDD